MGVNANNPFNPYFQANTQQFYSQAMPGKSVGNCNVIPCIGSPVFLIEKAHNYIDQQFDLSNNYSSVDYLFFSKDTSDAKKNSIVYKFVFEASHFGGSKYIGVEVDTSIEGMGNAKYNRFILHRKLETVKAVLGIGDVDTTNNYSCGDLKYFYTYYNRGNSGLPYNYAGNNGNTVSDYMLQQIAEENQVNTDKVCSNKHYQRVFSKLGKNYFRDETLITSPPLRENFYCNPDGLAVDRIRIGCRKTTRFMFDNLEAFQLIRKDPKTGRIMPGPIQGNANLAERYFLDISLYGSSEVSIEFWGNDK